MSVKKINKKTGNLSTFFYYFILEVHIPWNISIESDFYGKNTFFYVLYKNAYLFRRTFLRSQHFGIRRWVHCLSICICRRADTDRAIHKHLSYYP